jgi:hypothetical protein
MIDRIKTLLTLPRDLALRASPSLISLIIILKQNSLSFSRHLPSRCASLSGSPRLT